MSLLPMSLCVAVLLFYVSDTKYQRKSETATNTTTLPIYFCAVSRILLKIHFYILVSSCGAAVAGLNYMATPPYFYISRCLSALSFSVWNIVAVIRCVAFFFFKEKTSASHDLEFILYRSSSIQ